MDHEGQHFSYLGSLVDHNALFVPDCCIENEQKQFDMVSDFLLDSTTKNRTTATCASDSKENCEHNQGILLNNFWEQGRDIGNGVEAKLFSNPIKTSEFVPTVQNLENSANQHVEYISQILEGNDNGARYIDKLDSAHGKVPFSTVQARQVSGENDNRPQPQHIAKLDIACGKSPFLNVQATQSACMTELVDTVLPVVESDVPLSGEGAFSFHRNQQLLFEMSRGCAMENDPTFGAIQERKNLMLRNMVHPSKDLIGEHKQQYVPDGLPETAAEEMMSHIDLTRLPSGSSEFSERGNFPARLAPSPSAQEVGGQPRLRYSEGATASHYCHICGRASTTAQLAACGNVRLGLCRKTLCEKCLLLHQRSVFGWAKARNSTWTCTHCRGVCPKRARCHQYQRNNMRRRMRNEKQAVVHGLQKADGGPGVAKKISAKRNGAQRGMSGGTRKSGASGNQTLKKCVEAKPPIGPRVTSRKSQLRKSDYCRPMADQRSEVVVQEKIKMKEMQMEGDNYNVLGNSGSLSFHGIPFEECSTYWASKSPFKDQDDLQQTGRMEQSKAENIGQDGISPTGIVNGVFGDYDVRGKIAENGENKLI